MAEPLAHYSFLPWFRQGLNSQIIEKDTLGASNGTVMERAQLNVTLSLHAAAVEGDGGNEQVITKVVNVIGPGDVKNISERVIVRVNPPRNVNNFEANNLAYVEFYEEDFLWRYTPASADLANPATAKRLRPWLSLIVLKEDEFKQQFVSDALSFISIVQEKFNDVFHNPAETWAFAHVHFNQVLDSSDVEALKAEVTNELNADPDTALSRLLCPRKLTRNTAYTAFLIPAFETGRLSGLGLDTAGVTAQTSSWIKNGQQGAKPRPFDFPVYFQWSFRTGNDGDFESLVSKLKPIIMKPESGLMPMDVQEVGYGMDGKMERTTMGMEAALRPPSFETIRENFPVTPKETEVRDQLKTFLNLSPSINRPGNVNTDTVDNPFYEVSFDEDPMIVPPLYGAWHSMAEDLTTGVNQPWFLELNLDFRNRAAAGLGTKVVQGYQEDLMHRAWLQVGKINEANQKVREAEFSKLINNAIFKKHLNSAKTDKFLMVTNALQHLAVNADKTATINHQISQSRIPLAAQSATFMKLTRSSQKVKPFTLQKDLLTNFNKAESDPGSVTTAKLKTAPASAISIGAASDLVEGAVTFYVNDATHAVKDVFLELLNGNITANDTATLKTQLQNTLNTQGGITPEVKTNVSGLINNIQNFKQEDGSVEVVIDQASYENTFDAFSGGKTYNSAKVVNAALAGNVEAKVMAATTKGDVEKFKSTLTTFGDHIGALSTLTAKAPIANIAEIKGNLAAQIKPEFALTKRITHFIKLWDGNGFKPAKELKPVMAHPEFPEPGYEYLEKISQNFILPNVDKLPNNSVTLLETNQRFIESYMAGLNHEMARELLWREYPTDQRGSYFRQFWNTVDNLQENDPDKKKDIEAMDKWQEALGKHCPAGDQDLLVLVVRGELLKKYPSTMVYAQKAAYDLDDPSKPRKLDGGITLDPGKTRFPLFKGELQPDITLFGFNLTAEEANGHRITDRNENPAGKNAGWFFVFKERPGQLQFGLDDYTTPTGDTTGMPASAPSTWNDFTWEHLVNAKAELDNYQLSFSKAIAITNGPSVVGKYYNEVPAWNSNAAEIASILYQDPVLFARHAGEMLNEDLLVID